MAVMNAQYKHPSSQYSQGLRDLIDAMLKVDPQQRPDIHQVSLTVPNVSIVQFADLTSLQVIEMTDKLLQRLS